MIKLGDEGRMLERASADLSARRGAEVVINSSRSVHSTIMDKRKKSSLEEEVERHIETTDHLLVQRELTAQLSHLQE